MRVSSVPRITTVITCMTEAELPFVREAVLSVKQQSLPCKIRLYTTADVPIEAALGDAAAGVCIRRVAMEPVGAIRNIGVSEAETEWVAFLDGDDLWSPGKLETQLTHAEKTQCPILGCRHLLIREDGRPFFFAFAKNSPMPSSWLVKRDLLIAEPFTHMTGFEDTELWKRLRQRIFPVTLSSYLIRYRVRRFSLSTKSSSAKRRKYLFAQWSQVPGVRFVLLAASRLWSLFFRPSLHAGPTPHRAGSS